MVSSLNQIWNFSSNSQMAIYFQNLLSMVYFLSTTWKSLSLVIIVPNGKSKFGADSSTVIWNLRQYTEERWSSSLWTVWPNKVFNRRIPAISHPVIMQVSISSITIPRDKPPGYDLNGAKTFPRDNYCVQRPSPRDRKGSQKPHPWDIKLENFTNISMNSDTIWNEKLCGLNK